jgi:hypothetical protein
MSQARPQTKFRALLEKPKHKDVSVQYKIVFDHNQNYVIGRIRYETSGPLGEGWSARCSEADEDLEGLARAKFRGEGRKFSVERALELFRQAYEELYP